MSEAKRENAGPELAGVVGFFDSPDELLKAATKVREAGYKYWDVFSPYPVHGMDDAMGIKRSPIPYVTFVAGLTGCLCAYALESWTSSVDWPLIVGGKPYNSVPAWIPVIFECTILFAGLSTLAAMLFFNRLPNIKKRLFDSSITVDRFAVMLEAPPKFKSDTHYQGELTSADRAEEAKEAEAFAKVTSGSKPFSPSEAADFLKKLGAKEVQSVNAEGWF